MDWPNLIQTFGAAVTAGGVLLAWWQLRLTKQQAVAQFEDTLSAQYREILRELPLNALLGKPLGTQDLEAALPVFYRYFDLSNEQAFLFAQGRIQRRTWAMWLEGIEQHLARPAFRQAWEAIAPHIVDSFDELRRIYTVQLPSIGVAAEEE